ncbi:MAG: undecaprenyldiphospho-muramoylpentapeptide beta-N-acetylglucosaminyltransferase [Armatimonadetes bacterium]|nr:undecaprenyldiphospho-muramoylpentapeptide beta-N-acetylglucosaminyltransferase [Armatimonadota bacterium]
MKPTVVLTGGGTGGHIYPALSIGDALSSQGASLLYIGNQTGPEARIVPQHGIPFRGIGAGRLDRRGPIAGLIGVTRGTISAMRLLRRSEAKVIVGTGGYACVPVALAGFLRRVPVILHEPNAVAGRANRLLGRLATRVTLGFPESGRGLPSSRCVVTGVAVRIPKAVPSPEKARRAFGLDPDRLTLLVAGGSQGAAAVNSVVFGALDRIGVLGWQILHQTGPKHFNDSVKSLMADRPYYRALPFIEDMTAAYTATDVAVARTGASSIAELALHALPAILVPYPYAADDHQRANAEIPRKAGAARVIDQSGFNPATLCEALQELAGAEVRDAMKNSARQLARPNAAKDIAEVALSLARP